MIDKKKPSKGRKQTAKTAKPKGKTPADIKIRKAKDATPTDIKVTKIVSGFVEEDKINKDHLHAIHFMAVAVLSLQAIRNRLSKENPTCFTAEECATNLAFLLSPYEYFRILMTYCESMLELGRTLRQADAKARFKQYNENKDKPWTGDVYEKHEKDLIKNHGEVLNNSKYWKKYENNLIITRVLLNNFLSSLRSDIVIKTFWDIDNMNRHHNVSQAERDDLWVVFPKRMCLIFSRFLDRALQQWPDEESSGFMTGDKSALRSDKSPAELELILKNMEAFVEKTSLKSDIIMPDNHEHGKDCEDDCEDDDIS